MSTPFTRRRCWGLTALPVVGLCVTALVESSDISRTGAGHVALYLGFLAALLGGGAAFLAWGRYLGRHGRPRVGTALERGVGVVFVAWIGWSLLLEITDTGLHSLAALEALVLGTAVLVDASLVLLLTRYNVASDGATSAPTAGGLLTGTLLFGFAVLWQFLSHRWTEASIVTLVVALAILGVQFVRLERRENNRSQPPSR